jgi:hypothetical protein
LSLLRNTQRKEERRSLPYLAFRPHFAAVRLHDSPGYGEPEACSTPVAGLRLPEAVEDVGQLL